MIETRPIVPPPFVVQQRAWECAYVLHQAFFDRLDLEARVRVVVVLGTGPDGLGWDDLAAMFVLFGETVAVRV
jgi:hypothetical protein